MHINLAVSLWCGCVSEWHFNGCGSIPGPDWPHRFALSSLIINYWFFFLLNFFLKIISAPSSASVEGKPKYTPNSRNFRGKYDFFSFNQLYQLSFYGSMTTLAGRKVWNISTDKRLHPRRVKVPLLVPWGLLGGPDSMATEHSVLNWLVIHT